MKKTGAAAGSTAIGGGSYGIYESTSTWDGFAVNLPLYIIGLFCAVVVLTMLVFALWKRVKALEGK